MDLFDGHCDTLSRCLETGEGLARNGGHLDLERAAVFGRYAQFFAIFGDRNEISGGMYNHFRREYALFQRELEQNRERLVHCRTAGEAEVAFAAKKRAAFLSVEGGELLDCDVDKLETAYELGVRAINLTWNHANALSGSNLEEPERGLSDLGFTFVRRMETLGMLVDVSHLSEAGFWDVWQTLDGPLIATHSNAKAMFFHSRNLTDEQFTAIIQKHGVVGLNLYPAFLGDHANIDTILAHLEHFWALGGEETVAMGGDWDGISETPRGISNIADLATLYETLLRNNYRETLVRSLFYSNMMRIVKKVCGT